MTCSTKSATMLLTLAGTTPAGTPASPTGTTRVYNGQFYVTPTVAGVTIKALAYDATCSTTTSDVTTTALFQIANTPVNTPWYQVGDLTGYSPAVRTIEARSEEHTSELQSP